MTKDYKIILLIIFIIFFLIFLTSFQISIINSFSVNFNIFLFFIILLVLLKKFYGAIFFSWFSGFLIDSVHFSIFGVSSLILLFLTGLLIILYEKALLTVGVEGIFIMSLAAILPYHFLDWTIDNAFNFGQEKFNFYFFNTGVIIEVLLTTFLLLIAFRCLRITILKKIIQK